MVWDQRTVTPVGKSPATDLKAGIFHVILAGQKLRGRGISSACA